MLPVRIIARWPLGVNKNVLMSLWASSVEDNKQKAGMYSNLPNNSTEIIGPNYQVNMTLYSSCGNWRLPTIPKSRYHLTVIWKLTCQHSFIRFLPTEMHFRWVLTSRFQWLHMTVLQSGTERGKHANIPFLHSCHSFRVVNYSLCCSMVGMSHECIAADRHTLGLWMHMAIVCVQPCNSKCIQLTFGVWLTILEN